MKIRRFLAASLALASMGACDPSPSDDELPPRIPQATPTSTDARVIALVGTLSGPDQWRGNDAFEGADVGVANLNRTRAEGEPAYQLVTQDDEGDPRRATQLITELAASPQTAGIVYAGPPGGLPPAEEALADGRIPALLCYGDLYSARLLSPHVFQVSPPYLWQARRLARYALEDRGYRRVGLLTSDSLEGQTARQAITNALAEAGGRVRRSEILPATDAGLAKALTRLKRGRVQALVAEGSPIEGARLARALRRKRATYRTTAAAISTVNKRKVWRPQLLGFDLLMGPQAVAYPAGTVAADSYARGAHYLPLPGLRAFRVAFQDWWDSTPLGWENRAYEAVQLIGWADARTGPEGDAAATLERVRRMRFSGLDVTLGPDDHTLVGETTVGLWVIPRPGIDVRERDRLPDDMPWVPLQRGFSIDGETTDVLPRDWKFLFRNAPRPAGPSPRFARARFGVTTSQSDPVH